MMGRQVNLHTFLDFSHQHCVVPSAVRLVQPTAGTNQDTAATVAAASAASTFVDPAFTLAVSVPAFVASATFLLLANAIAFALSMSWLLANAVNYIYFCFFSFNKCPCDTFNVWTATHHML